MSEIPKECPIREVCAYLKEPNRSMDLNEDGQEKLFGEYESTFSSVDKSDQIRICQQLLRGACLYTKENRDELMTYFIDN